MTRARRFFSRSSDAPPARILASTALLVACGNDPKPPGAFQAGTSSANSSTGSGGSDMSSHTAMGGGGQAGAQGDSGSANGTGGGSGGAEGPTSGGSGGGAGSDGSEGDGDSGAGGTVYVSPCEPLEPADVSDAVCNPDTVWAEGQATVRALGSNLLATVTPNELTLAWMTLDPFVPRFWVADRETRDEQFSDPTEVTTLGSSDLQQIALSPDGLRLVLVVAGRLRQATRDAPGEDFAAPTSDEFEVLNGAADDADQSLADPVISSDDLSLYYTVLGAEPATLHVAKRSAAGTAWPLGSAIDDCELSAGDGGIRQPTGISDDELTLFYYDLPRDEMRAAWRASRDEPFTLFVKLPRSFGAQPSQGCDRLYGSTETENRLQPFVYEAE